MAYMPNGGPMPPTPMGGPGGPMGPGGPPGGPMPPAGGAPPPWRMEQLMQQQQQQEPQGELVGALQQLLDRWTERDPNTVAGSYYQDLANLLASFG